MSDKNPKTSVKLYMLLVSLWLVLGLRFYEDRLPEVFSQIITTVETTYTALLSSIQSSPTPYPRDLRKEATPRVAGARYGDILRILNPQAPDMLNPHLTIAAKNHEAARITYEPLASFDKDGKLVLFLAADVPSIENGGVAKDGRSVTWKLKHNVKWSDGQPFTANDVLFTYQFISNPDVKAVTASSYSMVKSVQAVDDYTVKVEFKDVNPAWALPFVGYKGLILPRHIFEPYNNADAKKAPANTMPVGTGPYRVIEGIKPQEVILLGTDLVKTNKTVFELNPYFRESTKSLFRRIELRGGGTPEEAARLLLQAGEVDYAYYLGQVPSKELVELDKGGYGKLLVNFGANVDRILLNHTDPNKETEDGERSSLKFPHPFFSDKKVRQAIACAIDREAIAALYGPAGRPTYNDLVAPPQYQSPNIFYKYDLKRAQSLLDESGWIDTDKDGIREKNGVKLKVIFQVKVSTVLQQAQKIVEKSLKSIGVGVELKIVDPSIMFGAGANHPDCAWRFNADLLEFGIDSPSPDPATYMQYWTREQIPQKANNWGGLNVERWLNPEYDALYQKTTAELDTEKRRQLFIQMNDMLVEDVVMIPVVYLADVQGVSQTIEGIELTPWDKNTWNIKDWRRVAP